MNDRNFLAALYSFSYFGPIRTKLLISYFGSAKDVWNTSETKLLKVGIGEKYVKRFIEYKRNFDLIKYFRNLKRLEIDFVTSEDKNYPENLKHLGNAPLVLYYKGSMKKSDKNAVAIVGSRKVTSYGRDVAQKFAAELASYGITIVSGLAFGVDLVAHKSCLDVGGRAVAVLASGLDMVTPSANSWLAENILNSGGVIMSEYPLGHIPQKNDFPERNRIISGLSKAVLIVEGAKKSGTLHTAYHAAQQGRSVFAVPGSITSPMSEAPNFLIQNGAKLVTSTKDILDELDMQLKVDYEEVERILPEEKEEKIIIDILEKEPIHLDELVRMSGLTTSTVSSKLMFMEIKGIVKNLGGGMYKKA